jgi:hypothetical protein
MNGWSSRSERSTARPDRLRNGICVGDGVIGARNPLSRCSSRGIVDITSVSVLQLLHPLRHCDGLRSDSAASQRLWMVRCLTNCRGYPGKWMQSLFTPSPHACVLAQTYAVGRERRSARARSLRSALATDGVSVTPARLQATGSRGQSGRQKRGRVERGGRRRGRCRQIGLAGRLFAGRRVLSIFS